MLIPPGHSRALQAAGGSLLYAANALFGKLPPLALDDSKPRSLANAADLGHLSCVLPPQVSQQLPLLWPVGACAKTGTKC